MDLDNKDSVDKRAKGQYNVSIPTSLALEYITGIHEERPEDIPPIKKYDILAINIDTLIRNFINSVDKVSRIFLNDRNCSDHLYAEIEIIKNTLALHKTELSLYSVDYKDLPKEFRYANIRMPTTPSQKTEQKLMANLTAAIKTFDFNVNKIRSYKHLKLRSDTLIMTHYPVDLIPNHRATGPKLLESHTGKIKDRYGWGSKLGLGDASEVIPFSSLAIQLFGDKSNHFNSGNRKLKAALIEHANSAGWTKKTTPDRMRSSIGRIKDREVKESIKNML